MVDGFKEEKEPPVQPQFDELAGVSLSEKKSQIAPPIDTVTEFSFNEKIEPNLPVVEQKEESSFANKLSSLKKGILDEQANSVAFGMLYQNRSGTTGMSALDTVTLPALDFDYYYDLSHKFYGHINFISLTNGTIPDAEMGMYGNGLGGNSRAINSLIEPTIGYKYTASDWGFQAEIGTTPTPAPVESSSTWKFKYSKTTEKFAFDGAFVQKSVKDTLLSRVGDTYNYITEDNATASHFRGGVVKQGIELGGKYKNSEEVFAGGIGYYYDISGYLIEPNEELAMTLLYVRQLQIPEFLYFLIGPIFIYDNFTYNSNHFTVQVRDDGTHIANGGYFSPSNFILLGAYFDFAQIATKRLFWRVKGNVGITNFTNKEDILGTTPSGTAGGVGYDVKGFVGYKFEPEIQILAGVGRASSGTFSTMFFGLSAVYYFGGKMSNNVDDLLRSNTIEELVQ